MLTINEYYFFMSGFYTGMTLLIILALIMKYIEKYKKKVIKENKFKFANREYPK